MAFYKEKTFDTFHVFETEFAGQKVIFETGKMCGLSNGSVLVRYGETNVLVNVTASQKPRDGIDFFPLSVDFEEKMYSVGKIPGSFLKREGRPTDKAVLNSRLVDRPIRPLFPKDMRNDCSVVMTVLSVEPDFLPEIAGMLGTSFALSISDIPFHGPISGVNVGLVDGEIIVNPNYEQRKRSDLNLTVVGTADKIVMVECGANEVPEDVMLAAIAKGQEVNSKMVAFIADVQAQIGKPKFAFESKEVDHDMFEAVKAFAIDDIKFALDTDDKNIREARLAPVVDKIHAEFDEKYPENIPMIDECIYKLQKFVVRRWLLDEGKRVDGRRMDEIRPLAAEVGLLPRVHGSGMFTRGQTQVLTIATLGPISDSQMLDGIDEETTKRYMHQYNFPSYSVGETRPSRGPGRREIGHGALAERALEPVLPSVEEFPYAMRLVSEVLSSNGSTSQASICGSTLALMDAGVPIKTPVAGISCGLITEGDRWDTMIDIQGLEDFFGDMDFKVGGTHKGITAIQMDIKIHGLTRAIIEEAIARTREARLYILDQIMKPVIAEPRKELSKYAPKIEQITIDPAKIGDVVGKQGKVINKIIEETGVKIDITDDGAVNVCGTDKEMIDKAIRIIKSIVTDLEAGMVLQGKVVRIMNFGAFVELAPNKDGMVHISKLSDKRVNKVEDVVNIGDEVTVKVIEIDKMGRVNLSMRPADLNPKPEQAE